MNRGFEHRDYEDAILDCIESTTDDCSHCEYASESKCRNQCMRTTAVVNPMVAEYLRKR